MRLFADELCSSGWRERAIDVRAFRIVENKRSRGKLMYSSLTLLRDTISEKCYGYITLAVILSAFAVILSVLAVFLQCSCSVLAVFLQCSCSDLIVSCIANDHHRPYLAILKRSQNLTITRDAIGVILCKTGLNRRNFLK